jgi:hypothetical protein
VNTTAFSSGEQSRRYSSDGKHMLNKYKSEGKIDMSDSDSYQHLLAANSCFCWATDPSHPIYYRPHSKLPRKIRCPLIIVIGSLPR